MKARISQLSSRSFLAAGTGIAATATVGSLYFSLGVGLFPCELCWYQRILMYPLVVILGVAAYENRISVYRTVLPLAVLGGGIAAYHSYLQLSPATSCGFSGGCGSIQWQIKEVGLTIPNLSLIAFVLIILLLLCGVRYSVGAAGSTTSPVSG